MPLHLRYNRKLLDGTAIESFARCFFHSGLSLGRPLSAFWTQLAHCVWYPLNVNCFYVKSSDPRSGKKDYNRLDLPRMYRVSDLIMHKIIVKTLRVPHASFFHTYFLIFTYIEHIRAFAWALIMALLRLKLKIGTMFYSKIKSFFIESMVCQQAYLDVVPRHRLKKLNLPTLAHHRARGDMIEIIKILFYNLW